jgi:hypothetical protein
MKSFRICVLACFLAASWSVAVAQTSDAADAGKDAAKASADVKKEQKKKDFAAQQKSMGKLSTPGRSMVDNPVDKNAKATAPVTRSGDKKKDFATQQAEMQKASTPGRSMVNNPVDKNAPASAPMKSISKMTPEERAQLRKDVVKDSKP